MASSVTSRWLLVPAACLLALMVGLGFLLTDVLPSTALGKWDAEVPRRLVEYRQQEGISESKLITTLSETPTIIILTALAAAVCRWTFGRWRESLVVIYAVVGETAIFMATTLVHRPPAAERPAPRRSAADLVVPVGPHRCCRVLLRLDCRNHPLAQSTSVDQSGRRRHLCGRAAADRRQPRVPRHALPDRRARRRCCSARSG